MTAVRTQTSESAREFQTKAQQAARKLTDALAAFAGINFNDESESSISSAHSGIVIATVATKTIGRTNFVSWCMG